LLVKWRDFGSVLLYRRVRCLGAIHHNLAIRANSPAIGEGRRLCGGNDTDLLSDANSVRRCDRHHGAASAVQDQQVSERRVFLDFQLQ
jgi:hypothetical protein